MSKEPENSGTVEFVTRRRVEFADTDMGGVIHFSRYFVFMESAEHLFLESLGVDAISGRQDRQIGWPRVAASCEFLRPVRFQDVLKIYLQVSRRGETSLHYDATIRLDGEEVARGRLTTVCCRRGPGGEWQAQEIPAEIAARVGPAPTGRGATGNLGDGENGEAIPPQRS